jgi:predicted Rdx family selenoprotein
VIALDTLAVLAIVLDELETERFKAILRTEPLLVGVTYDGETIWERPADGGSLGAKILKHRLGDRLDPQSSFSNIDRVHPPELANEV